MSFITNGWAGHLSYLLLVVSMLMRRMLWLRFFVIASAMVGVAFDHFWLHNPVGVFWQSLLVLVNLGEMLILWRNDRVAVFSAEEEAFRASLLAGLSPGRARRFLDLGRWENLPAQTVLTQEGRKPAFLTFLAQGEVGVSVGGRTVRVVSGGHYIGEMSLMGDGNAAATAVVLTPSRGWRIERPKLERLRESNPQVMAMVETGIAKDMRAKLIFRNATPEEDQTAETARETV